MDRFWDALYQSTIISGLLALAIWFAIIFMAVSGNPIPDILYFGGATVIAFFFGSKTGTAAERLRIARNNRKLNGPK